MNWKPIPRTAYSYSASDTGEIRRDKPVKGNHKAGQTISQGSDRYGYPQTSICVNGKQSTVTVHRLVAMAFLGDPPKGKPQINHKNGIKTDNRPDNLEWCTVKHNIRHALEMGLKVPAKGEQIGNSKLREAHILDIRSRNIKRGQQKLIAKEFGVSEAAVSMIVHYKIWKHLSPEIDGN